MLLMSDMASCTGGSMAYAMQDMPCKLCHCKGINPDTEILLSSFAGRVQADEIASKGKNAMQRWKSCVDANMAQDRQTRIVFVLPATHM